MKPNYREIFKTKSFFLTTCTLLGARPFEPEDLGENFPTSINKRFGIRETERIHLETLVLLEDLES